MVVGKNSDMTHRDVVEVLDGIYFVVFEGSLSERVMPGVRAFDTFEVAGADTTSSMVGASDIVKPSWAIGTSRATGTSGAIGMSGTIGTSRATAASGAIRTSGTIGITGAIKKFGGAVKASYEREVEAVVTGGCTDTDVDGSVGLGFCSSSEKSEASPDAKLICSCPKAIVTVGAGSGCAIDETFGAAVTDFGIGGISRG